jgi:hypothetical protein
MTFLPPILLNHSVRVLVGTSLLLPARQPLRHHPLNTQLNWGLLTCLLEHTLMG